MFSDIIGVTSLMDDSFVHAELLFAVFTSRVSSTLATQSFGYGIWTLHGRSCCSPNLSAYLYP
jgi:hypothetical protein